jgi:carboxypeptidase PM20D1
MTATEKEPKTEKKKIDKSEMVLKSLWEHLGKKLSYDKINPINVFDNCWRINIYKLREKEMPAKIIPPIKAYLTRTSAYTDNFWKKMSLSNLWLFEKWVINDMSESPASNALIRTTIVPTVFNSGVRDNVIPTFATAYVNSRILPGQTSDDVLNFVIKAVNDDRVTIKKQTISLMEPSPVTSFEHPSFKKLENIVYNAVPNAIVSPYLLIGATDSRYFRGFSEAVLNFVPVADVKGFHGIDERIGKTDLTRSVHFYKQVIKD